LLIVLGLTAILPSLALATWHFLVNEAIRVHERGVTRELATWEVEEARVLSDEEAFHAIDMLTYVENYYVPTPQNHSDPATDAALEEQRERTLNAIAAALERFSGEHYGRDVKRWQAWRQRRQTQVSGHNPGGNP
jgi:hypothetical protein